MILHGTLHHVEGDHDNGGMWYSVAKGSETYEMVCGAEGMAFMGVECRLGKEGGWMRV